MGTDCPSVGNENFGSFLRLAVLPLFRRAIALFVPMGYEALSPQEKDPIRDANSAGESASFLFFAFSLTHLARCAAANLAVEGCKGCIVQVGSVVVLEIDEPGVFDTVTL